MTRVTIFHSDRFDLVSYGNGAAYALHDNANAKSLFVQDDKALDLRLALDHYERCYPHSPTDDILAELMWAMT